MTLSCSPCLQEICGWTIIVDTLKGRYYRCRILENRQLYDLAILQPLKMNLGDLEEDPGRPDASAFGEHDRDGVVLCDELVRL